MSLFHEERSEIDHHFCRSVGPKMQGKHFLKLQLWDNVPVNFFVLKLTVIIYYNQIEYESFFDFIDIFKFLFNFISATFGRVLPCSLVFVQNRLTQHGGVSNPIVMLMTLPKTSNRLENSNFSWADLCAGLFQDEIEV